LAEQGTTQPDDYELMQGVRAGNPESLRALYDRHAPVIYALCLRVVQDRAEAEELLVDVFWEAWDRADRFDPSRGSPLAYLTTLARSRSIDRRRARPKLKPASIESHDAPDARTAEHSAMQTERQAVVRNAIRSLEPAERQAIESAFYDGMSHSEIAEYLKKPLGTIKTHIRQALIRLRGELRKYYDGAPGARPTRQEHKDQT
jgi:RNA polymerase sigma-70 factor (ECF subfamily)